MKLCKHCAAGHPEVVASIERVHHEVRVGWGHALDRAKAAEDRVADLEVALRKDNELKDKLGDLLAELQTLGLKMVKEQYGTPANGPIPPGQETWLKLASLVGWDDETPEGVAAPAGERAKHEPALSLADRGSGESAPATVSVSEDKTSGAGKEVSVPSSGALTDTSGTRHAPARGSEEAGTFQQRHIACSMISANRVYKHDSGCTAPHEQWDPDVGRRGIPGSCSDCGGPPGEHMGGCRHRASEATPGGIGPAQHQCRYLIWLEDGRNYWFCTRERGHFAGHSCTDAEWTDTHPRAGKWEDGAPQRMNGACPTEPMVSVAEHLLCSACRAVVKHQGTDYPVVPSDLEPEIVPTKQWFDAYHAARKGTPMAPGDVVRLIHDLTDVEIALSVRTRDFEEAVKARPETARYDTPARRAGEAMPLEFSRAEVITLCDAAGDALDATRDEHNGLNQTAWWRALSDALDRIDGWPADDPDRQVEAPRTWPASEIHVQHLRYDPCFKNASRPCRCCKHRQELATTALKVMREWDMRASTPAPVPTGSTGEGA